MKLHMILLKMITFKLAWPFLSEILRSTSFDFAATFPLTYGIFLSYALFTGR